MKIIKLKGNFKDKRGSITDIFYNKNFKHVSLIISKKGIIRGNNYFKNNTLLYFILFSTTFISLIIGERANFIKFIFMVIFFIYLFEKKNFYCKSILIFLMIP